jgi:hypothetical protein
MRDLFTRLQPAGLIAAAVLAADNTPIAVDLQGARSALVLLGVGIGGITFDATNKIEFVFRHGDTSDPATHVPVAAGDVQLDALGNVGAPNGIVRSLVAAHAAGDVQAVGYVGGRRYISLFADFSGMHGTGTPVFAAVLKGNLNITPAVT